MINKMFIESLNETGFSFMVVRCRACDLLLEYHEVGWSRTTIWPSCFILHYYANAITLLMLTLPKSGQLLAREAGIDCCQHGIEVRAADVIHDASPESASTYFTGHQV